MPAEFIVRTDAASVGVYVPLVRVLTGSRTFVTAVVVAVTTKRSHWSTTPPVADVFIVAMSIDHTPAAYEPRTEVSNIQPFEVGVTTGAPVVAFDAVPGMYGHDASVVPFATDVPDVAVAPCVVESCAIDVLAERTVDAVDLRKSTWTATGRCP